jgi:hypothetical protein
MLGAHTCKWVCAEWLCVVRYGGQYGLVDGNMVRYRCCQVESRLPSMARACGGSDDSDEEHEFGHVLDAWHGCQWAGAGVKSDQ